MLQHDIDNQIIYVILYLLIYDTVQLFFGSDHILKCLDFLVQNDTVDWQYNMQVVKQYL